MSRRLSLILILVGLLAVAAIPQHSRAFNPPVVAIQAGHWRSNELPEEFSRLRGNTGASAGGVREVDLNVDIAHRAAEYLRSWGNEAYVLPSTVPPTYRADAFVSLHSDGHSNTGARGYKVATYYRDWVASSMLVREIEDEYGKQTGLPKDWRITHNMRGYYAFNSGLYEHTIAEDTPGAILEMGFLSNPADRAFLTNNRDLVARAIALGIARFLGTRPAGGWPSPPLLPGSDKVEVLNNSVPLHTGPGKHFRLVDRASRKERYAVVERLDGWARLFFYDGKERWIEEFQTRPIFVP
ncbi:MAG TPA: N-acetylmuramoyl-L-alanine amidase [Herpetosiphonaceae bacterium]